MSGERDHLPPASNASDDATPQPVLVVPTHVLHLPVVAPTATLYLSFSSIAAHKPLLTVGALHYLHVDSTASPAGAGADNSDGTRPSSSYLIHLQPLLPSHRLHLHPLSDTVVVTAQLPRAALCPLLHAQLSQPLPMSFPSALHIRTRPVQPSKLVAADRLVLQPYSVPAASRARLTPVLSSVPIEVSPAVQQQLATFLDGCAVTLSSLISTDHLNHLQLYSVRAIEPSQPPHAAFVLSAHTAIDVQTAPLSSAISFPSASTWLSQVKQQVRGYDTVLESIITTMHRTLIPPTSSLAALYPAPIVFLLHGLPGTGKSLMAAQICQHSTLPCVHLSAADLYQKLEGEGEERIEATFAEARKHAQTVAGGRGGACVIVEDVDTICPEEKDEAGEEMEAGGLERALVASFCRELDELHFASPPLPIFVFFTTSRLARVTPSLLRQGRIDRKVHLPALSPQGRQEVLRLYSSRMTLVGAADEHTRAQLLQRVSDRMHGYVAADVEKLCREICIAALSRATKLAEPVTELRISESELFSALQAVRPANLSDLEYRLPKDISATASSASPFADLAGLDDIIAQLQAAIINPLLTSLSSAPPTTASSLPLPSGLLLYGPTGVAKTSLALALALSSTLPPLIVQSTSLVSSVVGQTEKNISALFSKARASAPCVLVIDQLDSIGQRRAGAGGADGGGGGSWERVVACLLQELDGVGRGRRAMTSVAGGGVTQPPVFVIATSGHPELLDPALLRPGRLDYHCHIPPPSTQVRQAIVRYWLQRMPVSDETAVGGRAALVVELARRMEGGSGADIAGVMREAGLRALRRGKDDMDGVRVVDVTDFLSAASEMRPSLKDVEDTHPAGSQR